MRKIGFMQGRLSPMVNGRIQCFPSEHWRSEYPLAQKANIELMEWTLDDEGLLENPFNTPEGQTEILRLEKQFGLSVKSVTCDHFMQAPFFTVQGAEKSQRFNRLKKVIESAATLSAEILVIPLVDNSSIKTAEDEQSLKAGFLELAPDLARKKIRIAFETDYEPKKVLSLLEGLPTESFGINYDIGNSASLGFVPREEFAEYGHRIIHVHVKDRVQGGTTVPLGTGSADFKSVFDELKRINYAGMLILQTARAKDEKHFEVLKEYRDFTAQEVNRRWN